MIPFNENWALWCKKSIIKHFDDNKGDTTLFVEGFKRDTDNLMDYLELRIDGPNIHENANDQWRLLFEVNVLVVMKENHEDAYRIDRLSGRVSELFVPSIDVFKYGDQPDDEGTFFGCLILVPRLQERIQVTNFGKIRPDTSILQTSVEGHYNIYLD